MNRNFSIKDVLEIIGIASVIAGLFFVGFEIRQNTQLAQNQAYSDYADRITEIMTNVATDEHLPLLFSRIRNGELPESFTPEEQVRLSNMLGAAVRGWEGLYRSIEVGILPSELLDGIGAGSYMNNGYFRSIWPDLSETFTEDFVEFFEGQPWNQ